MDFGAESEGVMDNKLKGDILEKWLVCAIH